MNINTAAVNIKSEGAFKLEVLDTEGNLVDKGLPDKIGNVVTYAGMYTLLTGSYSSGGLWGKFKHQIGTGTTELTRSSTGLGTLTNSTPDWENNRARSTSYETDNLDGTSTIEISRTSSFALGTVVGTFSEVGTAQPAGFVAGQLIKDEFGSPTTITILADEQLRITYTLSLTVPAGSGNAVSIGTGTVTTQSSTSNYTVFGQPILADYLVGGSERNAIFSYTTGDLVFCNSLGNLVYFGSSVEGGQNLSLSHDGSGTVTLTMTLASFPPSSFNSTDIAYVIIGGDPNNSDPINTTSKLRNVDVNSGGYSVIEFSPVLEKSSSEAIEFAFSMTYTI